MATPRGGAALSVRAVTAVPIKFVGTGETIEPLETFHPDRMASRILGMGDVLSLVERAEQVIDERQAKEMQRKMREASFGLDDFSGSAGASEEDGIAEPGDEHAAGHERRAQ